MFFGKKASRQSPPRPSLDGSALFAEIMVFGKQDPNTSVDASRAEPAANRKVEPSSVEPNQSSSGAGIASQGGATIYYAKNGENAEAYHPSRTFTLAKARILLKSGYTVYVVDSEGRCFLPEEIDRLLAFDDPRAAVHDGALLADTKIDAVLDVLNDVLTDMAARTVTQSSPTRQNPQFAAVDGAAAFAEAKIDNVLDVLNKVLTETASPTVAQLSQTRQLTTVALAETKIDAVLDVLNNILTDMASSKRSF